MPAEITRGKPPAALWLHLQVAHLMRRMSVTGPQLRTGVPELEERQISCRFLLLLRIIYDFDFHSESIMLQILSYKGLTLSVCLVTFSIKYSDISCSSILTA